jgi:AmmeMemoRadiSam system protein B
MASIRVPSLRKVKYAGSWYSDNPKLLNSTIEKALDKATLNTLDSSEKELKMAVLPHAGLHYSSRGLAHLLLHSPKKLEQVLIIAPSHNYVMSENTLAFGHYSGYETPIGNLGSFKIELANKKPDATLAIDVEHAIEMVLPFLAYIQNKNGNEIKVATALISQITNKNALKKIGDELLENLDFEKTFLISSSDFSHYGSRFSYTPFGSRVDKKVIEKVKESDLIIANDLAGGNLEDLFQIRGEKELTICGLAGSLILSYLANRKQLEGVVIDYYTSLDVEHSIANDFVAYATVGWR